MIVGQSRKHSVLEAVVNVAVGYGVALLTQLLVFPLFGIYISIASNAGIGVVYTVCGADGTDRVYTGTATSYCFG